MTLSPNFRLPAFGLLAGVLLAAAPGLAQETAVPETVAAKKAEAARKDPDKDPVGVWSLVVENDLFYNTDQHYTSGVRFTYLTPKGREPAWLRRAALALPMFNEESDIRIEYALGQSMFTPGDIKVANPPPGERPYAGWLYGTVGVVARTNQVLDQASFSLGMVGPASLAEQSQKFIHEVIGSPEPQGWDTQLKNEPTLQFTYQRSWQSTKFYLPADFAVDATPHAGFALGNVFTYANTGLMFRLGQNLPVDYGPPRVQPSLPGSGYFERPDSEFGWYLFGGVDGRAVARNIFLDGNSVADSRSVDKEPLVGDLQFGLALVVDGVRFAYTHVLRTREYEGQDADDQFGAFSVSVRF